MKITIINEADAQQLYSGFESSPEFSELPVDTQSAWKNAEVSSFFSGEDFDECLANVEKSLSGSLKMRLDPRAKAALPQAIAAARKFYSRIKLRIGRSRVWAERVADKVLNTERPAFDVIQDSEETYVGNADLDIFSHASDIEHAPKVRVPFRIEIEHRSWGVNGIEVTPIGEIQIPVQIGSKEINISVDLTQLTVEKVKSAHNQISVSSVEIYLNPDATVDYRQSTITFYA